MAVKTLKFRSAMLSLLPQPTYTLSRLEAHPLGAPHANAAVAARDNARQANREFRDVGERRRWVDRMNAARKEVYGTLAKLPHEGLGLPSDFADQFFLSESD